MKELLSLCSEKLHCPVPLETILHTYVKTTFGKGKTWKRRGLIVSHVNYDGLVRRLFVVLCVHEVRAMVQQEDSSSIFLLQTSRKSKYIRYFLSQKYWQNKQLSALMLVSICFKHFTKFIAWKLIWNCFRFLEVRPLVDLYLIFVKSSSTNWIFSLQKSISKLIFAGDTE